MRCILFFLVFVATACGVHAQAFGPPGRGMAPPQTGPYTHWVMTAVSGDGLTWKIDHAEPLVRHASVPAAMVLKDGTIMVYFVDASQGPDRFGCLVSKDSGATYQVDQCKINNLSSLKGVDFSPVALPDGRYRLYYYASAELPDSPGIHHVNSAISTDGRIFTEEGTVFSYEGLVDPDIFFNDKQWVMHVFSLSAMATVVATSDDGLHFTFKGFFSPKNIGLTQPIKLPAGGFRMYGFQQPDSNSFVSLISPDGLTWTQEAGQRLTVPNEFAITDPFVVQLKDNSYRMFFKEEKRKKRSGPPPSRNTEPKFH